jgi:hypothetical protein
MSKLALGVAMALTVLTGEARAGTFQDGNKLYAVCTSSAPADQIKCAGYVEGVADYLDWVRLDQNKPQCVPADAVAKQVVDVVVNLLRNQPEVRSYNGPSVVVAAVMKAWNCQ